MNLPESYLADWTWDLQTGIVTGSEEMLHICGLADAGPEIHVDLLWELVHPEDRAILQDAVDLVLAKHCRTGVNYRINRPDCTVRLLHTEVEAIFDENNVPLKIFGIDHDITELLQVEQALLESRENYQKLVDSIDEGFCIIDMIFDAGGKPVDYRFPAIAIVFNNITERKRVEEALRASEKRQAFLLVLSDALQPIANPVEIQSVTVRLLGEHLGANQVHYGETVGDIVTISQGYGNGLPPMVGSFHYMNFGERLVATYRAGRTAVCHNVDTDSMITKAEAAVITGSGFRAYIAVPLVKNGQWVATLAAHSIEPRAWTPQEVALVEEVAERTWAAVEHARAEEALRESKEQLANELEAATLLQKFSIQKIQSSNVEQLYDQILITMSTLLHSDYATLQLFYPERGEAGELHLIRHYGIGNHNVGSWEWITPQSRSSCGLALKTRQRVVFPDVLQCNYMAGGSYLDTYLQIGIRAVQTTPLISHSGDLLGMFSTYWHEPHELTESEVRSLDLLTRQTADLIELMQIYEKLEHKIAERTAELTRSNENLQQEIAERTHAQQSLLESEGRYRSLVENANEAIVVIQDHVIKFANPMAEQIFTAAADQLTNHPFLEFVHPDDRKLILDRPPKRNNGDKIENPFNYRLVTSDGSVRFILENSVAIQWEGRPAILALLTDVTEVKIMEEEMIKEDKLESIGILAGGIAHDFNNYLAMLLANISLAKLYGNNLEKIQEKLENMEKATLRAKDLSNQLFTFARGGAPVTQKVCIRQLITDNLKFTLSGSSVRPQISVAEDLHVVEVDERQLGQVLSNITINALQAMPEGDTLEVRAENITLGAPGGNDLVPLAAGSYVKIMIRDEGTGIPQKYLKKIFDPFFTTKDKGRGLGLAISYSIIKNHGGHIKVESEMGVGTCFCIYLPALRGSATGPAAGENVFKGTGRILIMDDEDDLLTVTGESLSTLGYEVTLARDGREAIAQYLHALNNEQPFDLVILDLTIPGGMGGKQTIRELLNKDRQVKAIVTSGYSNDPVMAKYEDYGFKAAVQKPFTIEALSRVVKEVISNA